MNYHIENTKPMVFGFLYSLVDGLKLSTAFSYVDNLYVNNNYITFLDYKYSDFLLFPECSLCVHFKQSYENSSTPV